jgi:hypothetical protein|tara:strand:- start:395 stop:667 length:273 start_codon:yes stop_codon:yes gene_type:complete
MSKGLKKLQEIDAELGRALVDTWGEVRAALDRFDELIKAIPTGTMSNGAEAARLSIMHRVEEIDERITNALKSIHEKHGVSPEDARHQRK